MRWQLGLLNCVLTLSTCAGMLVGCTDEPEQPVSEHASEIGRGGYEVSAFSWGRFSGLDTLLERRRQRFEDFLRRLCSHPDGSYDCDCDPWFNPDHVDCSGGVDECAAGTDDCDRN